MTPALAIVLGLVAHLVGDYVLQSHWMSQEKTERWLPAVLHAISYGLPFLVITRNPVALAVIVVTHAVIDRYRLARHVRYMQGIEADRGVLTRSTAGIVSTLPPMREGEKLRELREGPRRQGDEESRLLRAQPRHRHCAEQGTPTCEPGPERRGPARMVGSQQGSDKQRATRVQVGAYLPLVGVAVEQAWSHPRRPTRARRDVPRNAYSRWITATPPVGCAGCSVTTATGHWGCFATVPRCCDVLRTTSPSDHAAHRHQLRRALVGRVVTASDAPPAPVEYGHVLGYTLAVLPTPTCPFWHGDADVYDTVEEAREVRNYINAAPSGPRVEIVQVRQVIVE